MHLDGQVRGLQEELSGVQAGVGDPRLVRSILGSRNRRPKS